MQASFNSVKKNHCGICLNTKNSSSYKKMENFDHNICRKCNLVYLDSLYDIENFIEDVNNSSCSQLEYWSVPENFHKFESVFNFYFDMRINQLKSFDMSGQFLDIGTGYGFWTHYLNKKGIYCEGIDSSLEAVKYCTEKLNLNVTHTTFENYSSEKKYNGIFLCDVLEHLEDPLEMINKCETLLEKGGFLYIQVPDVIGFKLPLGHSLGLPHHIWQFNLQSLKNLIYESKLDYFDYHKGVQGVVGEYVKGGPSLSKKLLWFLARKLKLGNRLQVVSIKK